LSISITSDAVSEIKRLQDKSPYLRIGIRGGGCSGFSYELGFETEKSDDDKEIDIDGIKVLVDRKSMLFLDGTELDFVTEDMMSGFKFNNPNAVSSCGCNQSFSV
jgi:iron-sulfur cluster assembly protein